MRTTFHLIRCAAMGIVAAPLLVFPAHAEQRAAKPASERLPGVENEYSIVKPAPEPLEAPSEPNGYTFKAGNTDIRISGSVSVEVGFGDRWPGQERR